MSLLTEQLAEKTSHFVRFRLDIFTYRAPSRYQTAVIEQISYQCDQCGIQQRLACQPWSSGTEIRRSIHGLRFGKYLVSTSWRPCLRS